MSIKTKLSLIFGFFTLMVCLLSVIGYKGSSQLAASLGRVSEVQMPALQYSGEVDMMHDGLRAVILDAVHSEAVGNLEGLKEAHEEHAEMRKKVREGFEKLQSYSLATDTLASIKEAKPMFEIYFEVGEQVLNFLDQGKKAQAEEQLGKFKEQFKVLEEKLGFCTELIARDAQAINNEGQNTPMTILGVSLAALLLGLLAAIWSVFTLSAQLRKAYIEISSVSKQVSHSGRDLSVASQQLATSSQEQASSTEETSSSLEEISGMVASSLKSSEQSVNLSAKVFEMVRSGTDSMSELQKAVHEIAEANEKVERLAKLIEEIGEKTELIDEIVFQTRLLSFNASVEAERAGEHGRGFAVVAQEVGNLAQMSGKSASEITQIVKKSIKEAHDVVQVNRTKVELGVNLCKKTYQQLQSIEGASNEISGNAENILRSSEEQNSGIQQINQAIQLISQTTQQNTSLAIEVSTNSNALEVEAEKLQLVVGNLEMMVYGRGYHSEESEKQPSGSGDQKTQKVEKHHNGASLGGAKSNVHSFTNKKAMMTNGSAALKGEDDPWEKL